MGFTARQTLALRRNLDNRNVRTRESHGRELSYIEGWYAISEANRICIANLQPSASRNGPTMSESPNRKRFRHLVFYTAFSPQPAVYRLLLIASRMEIE
jgi:hypothetical protein